jgi:hypothetical protein
MRLTLRTLLAYIDNILEPADAQEISKKVEESEFATNLMHRMRDVTRRLRLGAPKLDGRGMALDANTVAEYLDNTLVSERVPEFEKICLESDMHLAEVASAHQILTLVLGEPAEIEPGLRERMYAVGSASVEGGTGSVIAPSKPSDTPSPSRTPTPSTATPSVTPSTPSKAVSTKTASTAHAAAAVAESAKSSRAKPEVPEYLREPPVVKGSGGRMLVAVLLMAVVGAGVVAVLNFDRLSDKLGIQRGERRTADNKTATKQPGDEEKPADSAPARLEQPPSATPIAGAAAAATTTSGDAAPMPSQSSPEGAAPRQVAGPGTAPAGLPPMPAGSTAPMPGDTGSPSPGPAMPGPGAIGSVPGPGPGGEGPPAVGVMPGGAMPGPQPAMPAMPGSASTPPAVANAPGPASAGPTMPGGTMPGGAMPGPAMPGPTMPGPGAPGSRPAPMATAPTKPPEGVGRFMEGDLLLRFTMSDGLWHRVPMRATVFDNDRVTSLPTYRCALTLASGMNVDLLGGTQVLLGPADAQGVPIVEVVEGRMVLLSAGAPTAAVAIAAGGRRGVLVFNDTNASAALEVRHHRLEGTNPEKEPSIAEVELFVTTGKVDWFDANAAQPETIPAPARRSLVGGAPAPMADSPSFPSWVTTIDERRASQKLAGAELVKALPTDRPVTLGLKELAGDRKIETSLLAIQCLAQIGDFDTLVTALKDPNQKAAWNEEVEALRSAIARSPETAAAVRGAFERHYGARGSELYRMLWGYTGDQINASAGAQLIKFLDSEDLEYRVLSFAALTRLTNGATHFYRPEYPAARRQQYILKWKQRLDSGQLAPKMPTSP